MSSLREEWSEVKWSESFSVMSNSFWPHGLQSMEFSSPDQNTGVGSVSLLPGIFPIQGQNPGLLHCRQILYQLSHQRSPWEKRIWLKSACDPQWHVTPSHTQHSLAHVILAQTLFACLLMTTSADSSASRSGPSSVFHLLTWSLTPS